ncbi:MULTISPECIES: hypothetical protein [Rhizobium/Agrobacterium group]|uniref:hypothetical protein n=1 Tax=Rhizobium oryzihabitans TaxID=2267833 RepID=UPI0040347E86
MPLAGALVLASFACRGKVHGTQGTLPTPQAKSAQIEPHHLNLRWRDSKLAMGDSLSWKADSSANDVCKSPFSGGSLQQQETTMARKPKKQRNAEQRERQKRVRQKGRAKRRPTRDDIARMLLWQMIVGVLNTRDDAKAVLDELGRQIAKGLEHQRFDVDQSLDVFDALVRKYSDGLYPFRPKRHLIAADEASMSE